MQAKFQPGSGSRAPSAPTRQFESQNEGMITAGTFIHHISCQIMLTPLSHSECTHAPVSLPCLGPANGCLGLVSREGWGHVMPVRGQAACHVVRSRGVHFVWGAWRVLTGILSVGSVPRDPSVNLLTYLGSFLIHSSAHIGLSRPN